jgi:hypothetical protein
MRVTYIKFGPTLYNLLFVLIREISTDNYEISSLPRLLMFLDYPTSGLLH